jgi:hypothetical protein
MRKRILVLVLLLVLMPIMTSCGTGDAQLLIDLALSWAAENAVSIAAYTAFGTSGNDEVDAVMDAKGVIDNINAADRLMEEGRQEGDLSKMEQAIEKRPGDYTYRVSYATALLKNGHASEAEAQFQAADEAVLDYGGDHAQTYAIQSIDELSLLGPEFEQNGFKSAEQCRAYYGQMAYFYEIRMVVGGSYFEQQRDRFRALQAGCQ